MYVNWSPVLAQLKLPITNVWRPAPTAEADPCNVASCLLLMLLMLMGQGSLELLGEVGVAGQIGDGLNVSVEHGGGLHLQHGLTALDELNKVVGVAPDVKLHVLKVDLTVAGGHAPVILPAEEVVEDGEGIQCVLRWWSA